MMCKPYEMNKYVSQGASQKKWLLVNVTVDECDECVNGCLSKLVDSSFIP